MKNKMRRHIANIKRSAGLNGNGSIRYEYMLTKEQLYDAYLKRMDDLGYPLKVEPKRDRYVMNSKVLNKAFEDATMKAMQQFEKEINSFIEKEVMWLIEQETTALLNTITIANGQVSMQRRPIKKIDWATRLGRLLGKELVKTASKIFEDTVNPKRTKRR